LYMQYFALLSLHRPLGRSVKLEVPRYRIYTSFRVWGQVVFDFLQIHLRYKAN
jgi:hypothetical protein